MKNKLLVIVDMQNDFIDGSLGTKEAKDILPQVEQKILHWEGDIACTLDTHDAQYPTTNEGRHLPVVHCVRGSVGWKLHDRVTAALAATGQPFSTFEKDTFGSVGLARFIADNAYAYIEFIGVCTDICVISNALLAKAFLPEAEIAVDAACCAGVTPESHRNALLAMKMCQISVAHEA